MFQQSTKEKVIFKKIELKFKQAHHTRRWENH